jgi:large subunit ribosomal protein L25
MADSGLTKLEAGSRKEVGKQAAKRLRNDGLAPGILYGLGKKPKAISVSQSALSKILQHAGGKGLVSVTVDGGKAQPAMILDIQREPVNREILHVDLKRIDLKKTGIFTVPIEFVGASLGVKAGGVVNAIMDEVEIECLPTELPSHIEADISELDIGDALFARDLNIPDGAVLKVDPDNMVINIGAPVAEEEVEVAVPAEAVEVAEGEEPEEKPEEKPEGEAAGEAKRS